MKLTPLDIRHKEFTRAMRGYKDIEVDEFLDEVVEEFERVFNENIDYKDKLENIEAKMEQYQNIEETLKKTLVSAQQQADELKQNAQKEADLILRDAELKSRGIINDSYAERQKVQRSVQALKQKYDDLRYEIRKVIEGFMNIIDQDNATAGLEEIDEMMKEAPPAAAEEQDEGMPAMGTEQPAPAEDLAEGSFGGGAEQAAGSGIEAEVSPASSPVEVIEDKTIIQDDPFADLETDSEDEQFKW